MKLTYPLILTIVLWTFSGGAGFGSYDPLITTGSAVFFDTTIHADGREIPLRLFHPADFGETPAPVILFSHGLGGSREGSNYLGRHWSARGYVTVFLQHPGSDASVYQHGLLGCLPPRGPDSSGLAPTEPSTRPPPGG